MKPLGLRDSLNDGTYRSIADQAGIDEAVVRRVLHAFSVTHDIRVDEAYQHGLRDGRNREGDAQG